LIDIEINKAVQMEIDEEAESDGYDSDDNASFASVDEFDGISIPTL
jgi:hypothetical protein